MTGISHAVWAAEALGGGGYPVAEPGAHTVELTLFPVARPALEGPADRAGR
jgi:hypothetical protein